MGLMEVYLALAIGIQMRKPHGKFEIWSSLTLWLPFWPSQHEMVPSFILIRNAEL